jgi:nucleotide-binding universal stress UspA family protein
MPTIRAERTTGGREQDPSAPMAPPYRPVIACVHDGPGDRAAARIASSLARRLGSRVLLATVQPGGVRPPRDDYGDPLQVHDARALLERVAGDVGLRAEQRILSGEPAEQLIALAARERAGLMVIPRPAPTSRTRALLGYVYLALAGAAPCPVVIVPRDAEPNPSGPIVCGIDDSERSLAAARLAADLAQRLDVPLSVVHVLGALRTGESTGNADDYASWLDASHDTALEMLRAATDGLHGAASVRPSVDRGAPVERLAELAERASAQLIVTGSRGRSGTVGTLLGSVSSRLAWSATGPVMIVPPTALDVMNQRP